MSKDTSGPTLRKRKNADNREDDELDLESTTSDPGSSGSMQTLVSDSGIAQSVASNGSSASSVNDFMALMAAMFKEGRDERREENKRRDDKEREERKRRDEQEREDRKRREEHERDERIRREKKESEELQRRLAQEESRRHEVEQREKAEAEKRTQLEEFQQQQLFFMRAMKDEEAQRHRDYQTEQRKWKEQVEKDKAKESRISSALRSFPKIGSTTLLPAQLNSYKKLLSGLEASQETMMARLPEVLSGAAATTYQNMSGEKFESFENLKSKFLAAAGITFTTAGRALFKPDLDALKKMTAVDLWCHLKGLVQRVLSEASVTKEAVSTLCVVFLNVFGSNNLILSLAGCEHTNESDVSQALYKTYEAFGSVLGNGHQDSQNRKRFEPKSGAKCEHCGRGGHKPESCWHRPKAKTVVCYTCNKEGHFASKCPDKNSQSSSQNSGEKNNPGGDKKKTCSKTSVVREPSAEPNRDDGMLSVWVGKKQLRVLPDSGAQVSVVPPDVVCEKEFTGESTCLVDFEGRGDRNRRVAVVSVKVGDRTFRERVAVSDHLGSTGILSLPITNETKSTCILNEFYRQRRQSVGAVQTRADRRAQQNEEDNENQAMEEDGVQVRDVCEVLGDAVADNEQILGESGVMGVDNNSSCLPTVGDGAVVDGAVVDGAVVDGAVVDGAVVNGAVVDGTVPVHDKVNACVNSEIDTESDVAVVSSDVCVHGGSNTCVSDSMNEVKLAEGLIPPLEACGVPEAVKLDGLREGSDNKEIRELIVNDPSLTVCKRLASNRERGYFWEDGLLFHKFMNECGESVSRLVVPKEKRQYICSLAHDKLGHLGHRKMRCALNRCFMWPMMGKDLELYVKSCTQCQKADKRGQRKVPLIERPILSEPFEAMAVDLVGPFPLAKGRYRYLLTTCCLATRWPDVVPLKAVTAKAVADGLLHIFGRCGLPYLLLCDNGSQFSGKLMSELTTILGVELRHSSPYHPEGNGMLERMHATLTSMIRKAIDNNLDWPDQIPYALFALRQMPCRSTGMSPYQLVWGTEMRTPLDIVYAGWRSKICKNLNISEWTDHLCDRLDILRDIAVASAAKESQARKTTYDRGKCVRKYDVGDCVWVRMAGKSCKLEDSWEGPFRVSKRLSDVNYCVVKDGHKKGRTLHVNLLKTYVDRKQVAGVTVLANESEEDCRDRTVLSGETCKEVYDQVQCVLKEFEALMDGEPGVYVGEPLSMSVVEGAEPVSQKPYRIPEAVKPKVKEALDSLIARGWVVPSSSPWAAPIVPVSKPDGSVRLCVNYKKVNDVTYQKHFPIPHFEDILSEVGQARVLSKMDLMKGYHQVPLAPECQDLTGFVTPWGCFKYSVLPFGLKNAPAIFQELMCTVLKGCCEYALVYIDDVLVYSRELKDHSMHVTRVLEAIKASGLKLNPKKCVWAKTQVEFLGHVIGNGVVSVPEARVNNLRHFKKPVSRKDLRAALGTFGYYRKFVPGYAQITTPLRPSTSTKSPNKVVWTPEMDSAFVSLCSSVCDMCALHVPVHGDLFVLHTDASGRGVGAVLYVCRKSEKLPVAFFSRHLRGAETRYSATELEALAIVAAVEHFVPYLYGRHFDVVTDHAPLVSLMTSPTLNRRLRNFMLKLLEFDLSIIYRPGIENLDADGLSRQAWELPEGVYGRSGSSLDVPASILARGDVGTPTQKAEKEE